MQRAESQSIRTCWENKNSGLLVNQVTQKREEIKIVFFFSKFVIWELRVGLAVKRTYHTCRRHEFSSQSLLRHLTTSLQLSRILYALLATAGNCTHAKINHHQQGVALMWWHSHMDTPAYMEFKNKVCSCYLTSLKNVKEGRATYSEKHLNAPYLASFLWSNSAQWKQLLLVLYKNLVHYKYHSHYQLWLIL